MPPLDSPESAMPNETLRVEFMVVVAKRVGVPEGVTVRKAVNLRDFATIPTKIMVTTFLEIHGTDVVKSKVRAA